MRRALTAATMVMAVTLALTAYAAPKPDKSLLGVKILSDWKAVLAKYGQPTRVEAGPLAATSASPMMGMSGASMGSLPSLGGMSGLAGMPGGPMMGGLSGPPSSPMMGGMTGPGGAPSSPMMGGMASAGGGGRGLPGLGGMGAGGSSGMMRPPMMGGMASAGGGSSSMMRPPMMGGMAGAGGSSGMMRPPMMGGGMSAPGRLPGMGGSPGIGAELPGDLSPGGMGGGMMGGMAGGTALAGGGTDTGEGEVAWIYEKKTTTHVFLFNSDGRVIQIQSYGYAAGARTVNGIGLGDTAAKIYRVYGFPEQTHVTGSTRTLDYSERANVAFQLADQRGKGLRVVGITVALVKAPDPENPE
ncbi:MAG: hypothetical protein FJX72_03530 [Armatimonadetes bacterium]|nr:hypothetical protein [Armatimonadota bacterium]